MNLSIGVITSEVAPQITQVSLNSTEAIVIGGTKLIEFTAIINDTNGNINASSITANISNAAVLSSNTSCVRVSGDGTGANFSCTVSIDFFNVPGDWRVSVEAQDNASNFAQNSTTYFTLQQTTAMNISSSAMSFPQGSPGDTNITASTGAVVVQNIGNKIYLNISVTGINLLGDSVGSTTKIFAGNFTVSNATGSNAECTNTSRIGASLVNATAINIEGANTTRGPVAKNNLYFCITALPPDVTKQTYSTGGSPDEDDWTIAVT